ncbi:arsenate reductase [Neisseria sp. ZJ106]|uniref:Arsenate reductase n=1 Tax=Neisseria lisongii TaxID=2912188 RepID=A0ABY7RHX1_9NEIS|nr:arsenate reductase [Neisseria lisongii]MCF7521720.1 arsenate reductase [Neisseria lisongii]WCL70838.1 arsenate reductase [Neisseria lisongii]
MLKLYGIPNCDTVKKARVWLTENGQEYEFVNFKNNAPTQELIGSWLTQIPLEKLLNKKGTTWRKLSDEEKAAAENQAGALALMAAQPSVIKRPVLDKDGQFFVGFSAENYQGIFA